jgi:hypothetical protein
MKRAGFIVLLVFLLLAAAAVPGLATGGAMAGSAAIRRRVFRHRDVLIAYLVLRWPCWVRSSGCC